MNPDPQDDPTPTSDPLADVGTVVVVDRSTIRALRRGATTEQPDEADPNAAQFDTPPSVSDAKRFAVYDRVLGRYVGGVAASKPSGTDASKLVGKHAHAIVGVG